jgi:hypothetical protein
MVSVPMRRSKPSATNHLGVENSHVSICFVSLLLEEDALPPLMKVKRRRACFLERNEFFLYSIEMKPIV